MSWKQELREKYRRDFGCPNMGKVCWCKICLNIENIINDVVEQIKKEISK